MKIIHLLAPSANKLVCIRYPHLYEIFQFLLQTLASEEYAALHRA